MIFVTGATGFVGRHFVAAAAAAGREVRALVRAASNGRTAWPASVEIRSGDLADEEALIRAIEGCAEVVHLAGATRAPRDVLWRTNTEGTRTLCAAARRAGVRRVVYASSLQADRRFGTDYGDSKSAAEEALRSSGVEATILRLAQIYGPRDRSGLTRVAQHAGRMPIMLVPGGGRSLIQPVHVDDVVAVIFAALETPAAGRSYDIAGPGAMPLADFIRYAATVRNRSVIQVAVPMWPIRLLAPLARLVAPAWFSPDVIRVMTLDKTADIAPACRDLGFAPMPVSAGLRLALDVSQPCAHRRDGHAPEPLI